MKAETKYNNCYVLDFNRVAMPKNFFGTQKLDTLGKLRTRSNKKKPIELIGKGSEIRDKSSLEKKAKKKLITNKVVIELIHFANKKQDHEMVISLWNTYHCSERLFLSNNKIHATYCRNRICTICNGIRKAEMINNYLPIVEKWPDPHFITLTAKSCPAKYLMSRMKNIKRAFHKIANRIKKRYQRGCGPKLIAIKSLECNFNPAKRTYNPHFHILVPSKELAEILKREWLIIWTAKFTSKKAQEIRKVEDRGRDLIELIKYGSKILTEPNPCRSARRGKISRNVYIAALYNILVAMRGLRLTDTYGFVLPRKRVKVNSITTNEYDELSYDKEIMDWVNEDTGELLSNFVPNPELLNILNNNINSELQ